MSQQELKITNYNAGIARLIFAPIGLLFAVAAVLELIYAEDIKWSLVSLGLGAGLAGFVFLFTTTLWTRFSEHISVRRIFGTKQIAYSDVEKVEIGKQRDYLFARIITNDYHIFDVRLKKKETGRRLRELLNSHGVAVVANKKMDEA